MRAMVNLAPELKQRRSRFRVVPVSVVVFIVLALTSWGTILLGDSGLLELFQPQTWRDAGEFAGRSFGNTGLPRSRLME